MKRKASKPRSVEQIIRILRQSDGGRIVRLCVLMASCMDCLTHYTA